MIANALRLIRVFHDLKQIELADKMGVSKSYISEIEAGKKSPSIQLIEKYSEEFKIPVSSILFFAERLEDQSYTPKDMNNAQGIIASKVIKFLSFVEEKTRLEE
ncbi:MAG: helix-turn-helix transcriptional regulator [Ignavibacteriaceae bacterium]|nr:MAG: helix-turn-helix transcriptional regulator [Ignavibacteriaceae bacterium]